jgi:hypothetical protein
MRQRHDDGIGTNGKEGETRQKEINRKSFSREMFFNVVITQINYNAYE